MHTFPKLQRVHLGNKRWYITPEGKKYPSMTTILDDQPKPWLNKWRKKIGEAEARQITKDAADRGTGVHKIIEDYLHNREDYTKGHCPYYVKSFNQIKPFVNRINNIVGIEMGLFSNELKVAGTLDCVAEYEGTLSVIDFKGSLKKKTKSQVTDYFIQCTGYSLLFEERCNRAIDNLVIIMCVDETSIPVVFQEKADKYLDKLVNRVVQYHRKR
ncbi:MAG: exonuclease [Nitrosopumilaceae archaeon]